MDASDEAAVGRVLHTRYVDGDATAFDEIYERYQLLVVRHIEFKSRTKSTLTFDEEIAMGAANRAFLDYSDHPEKFDPKKSALLSYLRMAAYRDYINDWLKEQRRRGKIVEIRDENGNTLIEQLEDEESVEDVATRNEGNERGEQFMQALCKTDDELIIVHQMSEGMKDAHRCIEELGWPRGEASVQRLYKEREKLKKRFKRNLPKLLGEKLP